MIAKRFSDFLSLGIVSILVIFLNLTSSAQGNLSNDLTAYWNFDDNLDDQAATVSGSGNTVDDDLTIKGTGSGYGGAKFGTAGYVGNGNGHAETPDSVDIDESEGTISISAWIQVNSFDTGWQAAIAKGEDLNYRIHRRNSSQQMAFFGGTNADIYNTNASIDDSVDDNEWHHLVATASPADGVRFYLNGVEIAHDVAAPNLANSGNPLMIGNNPDSTNRQWKGGIDDVAIWHRVLTTSEVLLIYSSGVSLGDMLLLDPDSDEDEDGLPNGWEQDNGLDPYDDTGDQGASGDPDSDDLNNLEEYTEGTKPKLADTDRDGISDGAEVNIHGTNPLEADSDDDGASDGLELIFGTDPNVKSDTPPAGSSVNGITEAGIVAPYLDGVLPSLKPSATLGENWQVENAFPNLSFEDLKGVVSEPRSNYIGVIERRGTIQRVDTSNFNTSTKSQTLNIGSLTVNGDNGGLRSAVFHPEFNLSGSPNRDYLYCFYSTNANTSRGFTSNDGAFFYRVSRFKRSGNGTFPLSSELVLIQQRSRDQGQHFGGGLSFDADGFLNISWGDMEYNSGRVGVPFYQDAQRIDRIFQAAVLRIDVDNQGGGISQAPTRTLQGSSGPWGEAGTSRSCPTDHPYYHVDNFSGRDYMIPSDNFFLNNPPPAGMTFAGTPVHGAPLEEHQALGVRNPWRMAVDPVDGHIAMFNVGSNAGENFEEVEILKPGANFGWPYKEGTTSQTSETFRSKPPSQYGPSYVGTETDPVAFWTHADGGTVATGGLFYRGSLWSQLSGQLIFGDHSTGKIWALEYKDYGAPSAVREKSDGVSVPDNYEVRLLVDSPLSIRQMTAGPEGVSGTNGRGNEILIAANKKIHRLYNSVAANPEPPALLSQTGAFTNLATLTPRAGLIPYTPASTLWSDRAAKDRWIAVPNTTGTPGAYDDPSEKIIYSDDYEWQYPQGTVFIKHFALPIDLRDPTLTRPVETRFLVHGEDGEYFYFSYQWRADGSDADLLPDGATANYDIVLEDGSDSVQTWTYPSRANCVDCHQPGAGHVLGMKSRQMNHPRLYPATGVQANQLTTFSGLGIFDSPPDFSELPSALKSAAINDPHISLDHRVRSYLDSNCSNCHRPESSADRAEIDLRLTTPLVLSGLLNVDPLAGTLGVSDVSLIKPGQPKKSILYLRDSATNENRMPPIGRDLNDPHYVPELYAWIQRLGFPKYDAWATSKAIKGNMTEDDDGNNVANILEFILGDGFEFSTLPRIIMPESGNPQISIPISGDSLTDGFTLLVEGSSDLTNWYPVGDDRSGLTLVSDGSGSGSDGVRVIRLASETQVFIRYGVEVP